MKKIMFLLFSLAYISIIYGQGNKDENQNQISNYYMELINNGTIKPLSMLKTLNINIYNTIIALIPENELIENYYFDIENLLNEENSIIQYNIWYKERMFTKYKGWRGDPTGKCFTVEFDYENNFIRKYFWR
jgi:hypothetical protein